MESHPECGSIQISFLILFKCCGLEFMLEVCHNTLFYDTANLIWQLTATRQSDLPCLSSWPCICVPVSSPALAVVLLWLPRGMAQCSKLTENYSSSDFLHPVCPTVWLSGGPGEHQSLTGAGGGVGDAEAAHGQKCTPGSFLFTYTLSWSNTANQQYHCWPPGNCTCSDLSHKPIGLKPKSGKQVFSRFFREIKNIWKLMLVIFI